MDQPPSPPPGDRSEGAHLPVACALGPEDGRARVHRWQSLAATASPRARRSGYRLEVGYAPDRGVREELESLAAAERQCCSFVSWEVRLDEGHPTLHVTADPRRPDDIAPIAALFGAD